MPGISSAQGARPTNLAGPGKVSSSAKLALFAQLTMATQKQIEANRRNAQLSTGPKTAAGKAVVKMNALRHGFRARTVVLPGENREEFHQLCDDLEAEWQPKTRTEQFMVELMAVSQWKLARMEVGEHSIFEKDIPGRDQFPLLDRVSQLEGRLERSYFRALRELERLQQSRRLQERQQLAAEAQQQQETPQSQDAGGPILAAAASPCSSESPQPTVPVSASPKPQPAEWPPR